MVKRALAVVVVALFAVVGITATSASAAGVAPVAKVSAGDRAATVTWSAGSLPGHAFAGFTVQHRKVGTTAWVSKSVTAATRKLVVTSLVNGQHIEFRVIAKFAGTTSTLASAAVRAVPRTIWTSISAGEYNVCAINSFHEVWCWGYGIMGVNGAPGLPDSGVPHKVALPAVGATSVRTGYLVACALLVTKVVWCWGSNTEGELGIGSADALVHAPVAVPGLSNVTSLTVSEFHACASSPTGTKCWGWNSYGRIGAPGGNALSPTAVGTTVDGAIVAASTGVDNTCGVTALGSVWCWGKASAGVLGNRDTATDTSVPQAVIGLAGGASLPAVGYFNACSLAFGRLLCWGSPGSGSMGILGTSVISAAPVMATETFPPLTSVVEGRVSSCALDTAGKVWCFGESPEGELGRGIITDAASPAAPTLLPVPVTQITGRNATYCALDRTGGAWCWGSNIFNEVSKSGNPAAAIPIQITRSV
jgi:alpha-tubulin suppressor-like RCC1 family protein